MAGSDRVRPGRVERALDRELRTDGGTTFEGERAALRALARAIDRAERDGDVIGVTRACRVYFESRRAVGLAAGETRGRGRPSAAVDWDRWLTEQSAPAMGDPADG
jgi:hypothetical protein